MHDERNEIAEIEDNLRKELISRKNGQIRSIARVGEKVQVFLGSSEENLAATFLLKYGNAVDLTVGAKRYPSGGLVNSPPSFPLENNQDFPFQLSIELVSPFVVSGDIEHGDIVVSCRSNTIESVSIEAGPGWLIDSKDATILAGYFGPMALRGFQFNFSQNKETRIRFAFGTDSFSKDKNFRASPGNYRIAVPIAISVLTPSRQDRPYRSVAIGSKVKVVERLPGPR